MANAGLDGTRALGSPVLRGSCGSLIFDEPCRGPTAASDTIVADPFAVVVEFGNQRTVSLFVCPIRFRLIQRLPLERGPEPRSGDKPKSHGVKQTQGC